MLGVHPIIKRQASLYPNSLEKLATKGIKYILKVISQHSSDELKIC